MLLIKRGVGKVHKLISLAIITTTSDTRIVNIDIAHYNYMITF